MRGPVDTANRSFLLFLAVVAAPYALLLLVCCGLVSILAVRLVDHGLGALTAGRGDLRPAAVVLLVVAVATALALRALRIQLRATRSLSARVRAGTTTTPEGLAQAAARTGLAGRVDLFDDDEPFSFAYGLLRPRVVVSRALYESVDADELLAVLEHERYHVRHLDPLKVVVARAASAAYFFLPALRGLRSRYTAASELAADRRAMRASGKRALAGALYRAVRGPDWEELSTAAAIGGPELLDVRVRQIESGEEPEVAPVTRGQAAATVVSLVAIGAVLVFTVVTLGGPGGMMRETMGSDRSMQGDMEMTWAAWWVAAGAALVAALWLRSHRHTTAP